MAVKGPKIPIYVTIESKQALKDYQAFQERLKAITKNFKEGMTGRGNMKMRDFKAWAGGMAALNVSMKGTVKTADQMKARMRALEHLLRSTNPDTKRWQKYAQKLADVRQRYDTLNRQIRNLGGQSKNIDELTGSFSKQTTYLERLVGRLAVYWGHQQGASFMRNIREITAEFEKQQVALGVLLQSVAEADILFERIKTIAVKSPFQIKELVTYTKQLSAYQIAQEELFDTTNRLADLSAGLGVDMERLILAYGQVKSASVLRGQEMRQFTEAGIPLVQALADKFTELRGTVVSTAEVFELVADRAVSFEMVKDVIEDMTGVSGQFYKMQEKQAETLAGRWSNLKDTVSIMYMEMGKTKAAQSGINSVIKSLSWMAANWRTVGKVISGVATTLIAVRIASLSAAVAAKAMTKAEALRAIAANRTKVQLSGVTRAILGNTIATKVETTATNLLATAQFNAATATNVLSRGFWTLTAAMASNPIGAIIFAVGTLTTLVLGLSSAFKDTANEAKTALDYAVELQEAVDAYIGIEKETDTLVDTYNKLFNKSTKSLAEEARLRTTINELVKRYGTDIIDVYDEEFGFHKLNIEKLEELIRLDNERRKAAIEDEIAKMEERRAELKQKVIDKERELQKMMANPITSTTMQSSAGAWTTSTGYSEKDIEKAREEVLELRNAFDQVGQSIADANSKLAGLVETSEDNLTGWRKAVYGYRKMINSTQQEVRAFTLEEVGAFGSQKDMIDDVAKKYEDYAERITYLDRAILKAKDEMVKQSLMQEKERALAYKDIYQNILTDFDAWTLIKNTTGSSKTAADLFTELTTAQADFFKDFQKNVEQMNRYIDKSSAIARVSELMEGRARELGVDILRIDTSDEAYSGQLKKLIDDVQAKVRKFSEAKGKNTLSELMGIKTGNEELQKYLKTLRALWDRYTDEILRTTEEKMRKSFEQWESYVKSAQVANDLYKQLLDLTGNEEYSAKVTLAIYGEDGKNLSDTIMGQLRNAFDQVNLRNRAEDDMSGLIEHIEKLQQAGVDISTTLDSVDSEVQESAGKIRTYVDTLIVQRKWSELRLFLNALPEEARKAAEKMISDQQKSDADWLLDISKTYARAKDFEDRRTDILAKAEKDRAAIREKAARVGMSEDETQRMITAIDNKERSQLAELDLEILKSTSDWESAFGDIERIGKTTISDLIDQIDELIAKYKEAGNESANALTPEALKSLTEARTKLTDRLETLNPFKTAQEGLRGYRDGARDVDKYRKELNKLDEGTQEYADTLKKLKDAENKEKTGLSKMGKGVEDINSAFSQLGNVVSSVQSIFEELGMKADSDLAAGFEGVAKALTLVGVALTFINGVITLLEAHPLVLAATAVATALISIVTVLNSIKTARANREIEAQTEAIERLEKAYEELEKVMERSFGSDYIVNYNQQLTNLEARIAAVNKQLAAEQSKGKKMDDEAVKEYSNTIDELNTKMSEMSNDLSEHFSGIDLTSAARDFAQSWIDAYKEFGNTTTAMSEQFQEMVQSMIVESLAARVMQGLLDPIFRAIDEAAKSGSELTAEEIANISDMTNKSIPEINDAMVNLMNALASAGLNVRQQAAGLTGISRDIAGASEESILGLAAGINTQNFYIAQTNDYVLQILTILRSGAVSAIGGSGAVSSTGESYLATLPTIAGHTASILRQCETMVEQCQSIATDLHRVVQPRGTNGSHWVVTS